MASLDLIRATWKADVQKNLYADNAFMNIGINDNTTDGKTVIIPQAGQTPSIIKNPSVYPLPITQTSETFLEYSIDKFAQPPMVFQDFEQLDWKSYDARALATQDGMMKLQKAVAQATLYAWAASASGAIVRTSGTASSGSLPHTTATGTRKLCTLADLTAARKILDAQNLGAGQIYAIVPSDMYWNDLMSITEFINASTWGGNAVLPTGVINGALGLRYIVRSETQVYDNTATPVRKTLTDSGDVASKAATDNNAIILIHERYVRKALGSIKTYAAKQDPTYQGDIISTEIYHGATKNRTDGKGIVSIVQSA